MTFIVPATCMNTIFSSIFLLWFGDAPKDIPDLKPWLLKVPMLVIEPMPGSFCTALR
jgi:hypothetical protein